LIRLLLAGATVCLLASAYFGTALDDAFITAEFSHELARTGNITWQGDRIEGYSNFLLMLLEALGAWLGADVIRLALRVALLSGAALSALLSYVLPNDRRGDLSLAALVLWPPLAYWSAMAFETTLFALLSASGLWLLLRRPAFGAGLLLLAALCRPEGSLFFGLGACMVLHLYGARRLRVFGVPALLLVFYHGFRLRYFGTLLPSAVELKAQLGGRGVFALAQDLVCAGGVLGVWGACFRFEPKNLFWVLSPVLLSALLQLGCNADWMAGSRLLLPGLVSSLLLASELGQARELSSLRLWGALPLLLFGSALLPRFMQLPELRRVLPSRLESRAPLLGPLSWLARHAKQGALIQSADIGLLGHLPLARVVDARGLTSSVFRQAKRDGLRSFGGYYASLAAPDIIQVSSFAPARLMPGGPPAPRGLDPWLRELDPELRRYPIHEDVQFREGDWLSVSRFFAREPLEPVPIALVAARFRALARRFPSIPRFAELAADAEREAGAGRSSAAGR
jgi:hypothetical protein